MTARPVLVIPEAAKAALAGKGKTERWVKDRVHPVIKRAVALHIRRKMFGPSMEATFRQACLNWSSFAVLKTGRM